MIGRACPHFKVCLNNSICMDCDGESKYKPERKEFTKPEKKRGGQKTEKKVIKRTNDAIKDGVKRAFERNKMRLTPNSGAGSIKGDSISGDLMQEMKERNHELKGGNKSLSVQKSWLEKLRKEAYSAGKDYYILPFTFGEDEEDVYCIVDYDIAMRMYNDIVFLKTDVKRLEEEIKRLKG